MITTITLTGAHALGWGPLPGQQVHVPGLDPSFVHTVRDITVSEDRASTMLTVDTVRPPTLDLIQHLSVLGDGRAKAAVRAVHAETGAVLAEGRYDAPLQQGQDVWIGGAPYTVSSVEFPHRHPEYGTAPRDQVDWQVATVAPQPIEDAVQPVEPRDEMR